MPSNCPVCGDPVLRSKAVMEEELSDGVEKMYLGIDPKSVCVTSGAGRTVRLYTHS